jgi:serine/threonine-protein kinase
MLNQLIERGAELARFIATQSSAAKFEENWVSVDVSVQQIMKTGEFHSITVIDRGGVVRAAKPCAGSKRPSPFRTSACACSRRACVNQAKIVTATRPTPFQAEAFNLLGLNSICTQ